MCTLQANMQCYDRFFEVFSHEIERNELMIEDIVSQLLLDFFEEVMVDVNMIFSPRVQRELQHCSIQVQAQCDNQIHTSFPYANEYIELNVENKMCSFLRELFGSVIVDCVSFIPSPQDYTYSHSSVSRV
jgi:hypothetical protein